MRTDGQAKRRERNRKEWKIIQRDLVLHLWSSIAVQLFINNLLESLVLGMRRVASALSQQINVRQHRLHQKNREQRFITKFFCVSLIGRNLESTLRLFYFSISLWPPSYMNMPFTCTYHRVYVSISFLSVWLISIKQLKREHVCWPRRSHTIVWEVDTKSTK